MSGSHDHHPTGEPDDDAPIVPVKFAGSASPESEQATAQAAQLRRSLVVAAAVALFFVALSVIFLLPRFLVPNSADVAADAPSITPEPDIASEVALPVTAPAEPEAIQEIRRSNQAQLEALLELVGNLEQRNVIVWAQAEFEAARALIADGEKAYREQRYDAAAKSYEAALSALTSLDERTGEVVANAVEQGYSQLTARNSAAAAKAFRLALAISPEHERAQLGLARAGTLDQVLALINEAAGYEDLNDPDAALKRYREALALDADAPGAASAVARIERQKLDARFGRAMSDGLDAVASEQFTKAKAAFQRALKLKPGSGDASSALKQVENRLLADRIANHLRAAATAEREERWTEAATRYRQARKLDADLDGAAASAAQADKRAKLDGQLEKLLKQPRRLSDDGVHREALAVLASARKVTNAGPRLSGQIQRLTTTIERARTPIAVTLLSDNLTDVTLYKVGALGRFDRHSVSVIPGRYVVVGKRDGFRDVRVEFEVSPAQADAMITVRCEQKLAFGS